MDEPTIEHDFRRTIPFDGLWCQRCGLSHALWTGEPCLARIHPSLEAKIVDLRARTAALEGAIREWADAVDAYTEDDSTFERVDYAQQALRALLPPVPVQEEERHE